MITLSLATLALHGCARPREATGEGLGPKALIRSGFQHEALRTKLAWPGALKSERKFVSVPEEGCMVKLLVDLELYCKNSMELCELVGI